MRGIARLQRRPRLTTLLSGLSIADRLRARRKLEMLADYWALHLVKRYGKAGAIAKCRRRMVFCAQHAPGLRWHLWCRIYHRVKPPEERRAP